MKIKWVFICLLLILPAIWPLFRKDFFRMHDFTHVARLVEMDIALKDGHFPPRWSKDLGWGQGMPLFHFYAPLPYYLAEAFHLLGFSLVNAIKIVFGLSFLVAFSGMYLLVKKFWGQWAGLIAALAFIYSPYRAVDFYVRGTLGELFAISLIPWVLWALTQVVDQGKKKKKQAIALASIFLALFFLSHTVLDLIGLPVFLLFSLFYLIVIKFSNKVVKKSWLALLLSFVLGLGLAGFFLGPAFFEKQYTSVNKLTAGFSHYAHHFLYLRQFLKGEWGYGGSISGIEDDISFKLGEVHLILAAATLILSFYKLVKKRKFNQKFGLISLSTIFIIILAFLTTYHSQWLWDNLPLLAFIQFPWRLNSFIIVFISLLGGASVFYLKQLKAKLFPIFILASIFLIIGFNLSFFKPESYSQTEDFYYADSQQIQTQMSGVIPDYLPRWAKESYQQVPDEEFTVLTGQPQIEVLQSKTHRLVLQIVNSEEARLQVNRFYFPGWKIRAGEKELQIDYYNPAGLMQVDLPIGNLVLEAKLEKTAVQKLSEILSLLSLGVILLCLKS